MNNAHPETKNKIKALPSGSPTGGLTFALDNTSSVPLVLSGRKRGKRKMAEKPFEVRYKDVVIRCGSAEDAARVARELATDSPYSNPWRMDEFTDFVNRIQVQQRRLLAALIRDEKHTLLSDVELRRAVGVTSNQALAGILSGVTKVAQAMGIEPKRIYGQRTKYVQGLPNRVYWATPAFREIAVDADWPSPEDLEDSED